MKIVHVVGARPNFMKIAPVLDACRGAGFDNLLVHTGQHYDRDMSELFFDQLGIPRPDVDLGVGSGSHATQTAAIMTRFEDVVREHRPDLVLVVGDVNSTVACGLVAVKSGILLAHVEAGLRSFDRTMPEEINRVVTDAISDVLFTTEPSGEANLLREGVSGSRIHFVGNVMIDTLLRHRERAASSDVLERFGLEAGAYGVLTLHRPANVDDPERLDAILEPIRTLARDVPMVFPVHPRTRQALEARPERIPDGCGIGLTGPLGYLDFLRLMMDARIVLTDSGGIQEETTILGVPCVTLRENTERPVTLEQGTNRLGGVRSEGIAAAIREALAIDDSGARKPELWDGHAAERIAEVLRAVEAAR